MANFSITRPKPDVVRVAFPENWDASAESDAMFNELLDALDNAEEDITLLIVTGDSRPEYSNLKAAWGILMHDNLKKMIVVAQDAQFAINHMGANRGERGLDPIPMLAFDTEADALKVL